MPVPWGIYYSNENLKKYIGIMKDVCQRNNVLFLDIEELANEDFDDGLHPNAIGHEKIFIQVRDFLTEKRWI